MSWTASCTERGNLWHTDLKHHNTVCWLEIFYSFQYLKLFAWRFLIYITAMINNVLQNLIYLCVGFSLHTYTVWPCFSQSCTGCFLALLSLQLMLWDHRTCETALCFRASLRYTRYTNIVLTDKVGAYYQCYYQLKSVHICNLEQQYKKG